MKNATGYAADATLPDTRSMLFQAGPQGAAPNRWYTAIRTKRYVYVEWANHERELYDLQTDPLQLRNIAGQPAEEAVAPASP